MPAYNFFPANVVFAQILIKIMHVYIYTGCPETHAEDTSGLVTVPKYGLSVTMM
jgi:hypothetical protein